MQYAKINDPGSIMTLLQQGPVAVGVNALDFAFQFYSSGIISPLDCSNKKINHVVLLVGLGVDSNNIPYWLIQNSFGTTWGNAGYAKIYRDMTPNSAGTCGINRYAVIPLV